VRTGAAAAVRTGAERARDENVSACFFMQDAHRASETDVVLPEEKRKSPPPGWASTTAATAAETAAAPTEVARANRHRGDLPRPSDDQAGGTDVDSLSTLANDVASRVQVVHGPQTPR